jgi:AraC-like DNA-binding protein
MRQVQGIREARADLVTRAAQAIRETIADEALSAEGVARRLGLSTRSLRRALQQAGTSYTNLVDCERSELARKYARQKPSMSGNDSADRLGYKNIPAFYRAFQRWTGMTLSAYREHAQSAKMP